jgi:hypothetical protein
MFQEPTVIRRPSVRTSVTTLAAAAVLVGGANVATYAASGHALILGHSNSAVGTTSLKNLGRGPALSLNSAKSSPPLVVNSSKLVKHLNAATVGGQSAAKLNPKVLRWRVGHTGTTVSSSTAGSTKQMLYTAAVPKGTYQVNLSAVFFQASGDSSDSYTCLAVKKSALLNDPSNPDGAGVWALDFGKWSDSDSGTINFTNPSVTLQAKKTQMLLGCVFYTGVGSQMKFFQPPTITFTPIVTKDLAKKSFTLPAPRTRLGHALARVAR